MDIIADVFNTWCQCILLDAKSLHGQSKDFLQTANAAIMKLQLDGLAPTLDINEMLYIADLWSQLITALDLHRLGRSTPVETIISLLLDLYMCKQFERNQFITCCTEIYTGYAVILPQT